MFKSCFLFVILLSSWKSIAQNCSSNKKNHIYSGFNLGLNQSVLYTSELDKTYSIKNAPGFRLGVFAEFEISKRWRLSPKSELSFNYGKIIESGTPYRVDPFNLDVMFYSKHIIKTTSKESHPYWNFGPNLRIPLNTNYTGSTYNTKIALALDFGFGYEFRLKEFTLAPELRFSAGLTDIRRIPTEKMLRGSNAVFVLNFMSN